VQQRADLSAERIAAAVALAAEVVAAGPPARSHVEGAKTAKRLAKVANDAAVAAAEQTALTATHVAKAVTDAAADVAATASAAATAVDLEFAEAAVALQSAATEAARQAASRSDTDVPGASLAEARVRESVPSAPRVAEVLTV
jgi:hypothetical protein